tara:strand:+ start:205 stop:474 length:270 start_codon:yes stop_codon:yes gene_type:complete
MSWNLREIKAGGRSLPILSVKETIGKGRTMFRLMSVLYAIVGTTTAGIGVIIALTMNLYDVQSIVIAAAVGAVIGLPVSWLVAKKLQEI